MTAKQYYKQTSDMAYLLDDYSIEDNKVIARIQLKEGEHPTNILDNNDFYALNDYKDGELNLNNPKFEINFIYNPTSYDVYEVDICDTIDCRSAEGGKMVLSCSAYEIVDSIVENPSINTDNSSKNTMTVTATPCFNSPFSKLFDSFMTFPNISINNIDSFFKEWDSKFSDIEKNGNGKYCSVTCKMDGNGNGYYRKVDNDGVVEKTFKKVDGEIKEIDNNKPNLDK